MKQHTVKRIRSEGELFKKILAKKWYDLHPDIQKRFEKNPQVDSPLLYQGQLEELSCSTAGRIFAKLTRFLTRGALLPYCDTNTPVDISVYSKKNCPYIFKRRIYYINNYKPIKFTSYMKESRRGDVLEYIGFGIGMKLKVFVKDENLHFKSDGYFIDIGICRIPIPQLFTPGKTYLSHTNLGQGQFKIRIDIDHCLFGKMFVQAGVFNEI